MEKLNEIQTANIQEAAQGQDPKEQAAPAFKRFELESILVKMDQLHPSKFNDAFDMTEIDELAESIKIYGILQPLYVRGTEGNYTILAGHKRFAAVQLLASRGENYYKDGIPCVHNNIKSLSELDEKIIIYEANIHNRRYGQDYLRLVRDLYYLYLEKQETDEQFRYKKMCDILAEKLGIDSRQAKKYVTVMSKGDPWLLDAFLDHKIPIDRAAIIANLEEEKREKLKEIFQRDGCIKDEILDTFRKKLSQIPSGQGKSEAKKTDKEIRDRLRGYTDSCLMDEEEVDTQDEIARQMGIDTRGLEQIDADEFDEVIHQSLDQAAYGLNEDMDLDDSELIEQTFDPALPKSGSTGYDKTFSTAPKNDIPSFGLEDDPSGALLWFSHMSEKGMTWEEKTYVDSMVTELPKFYFSEYKNKGYIDESMKKVMREIVNILVPLLEEN